MNHYQSQGTCKSCLVSLPIVPITSGQEQGRDSDPLERRWITITKHEAAERLVNSFSAIPTDWVHIVAERVGAEFYGMMWGTMFLVNDPVDKQRIHALLCPVTDEEDDLYSCQEVGQTGISAFDIDGQLVLGINGAGYDFYEHHWIPLYEALDYSWHETA